ncbi:hypothetical protein WJX73_006505 [Symbiochloris irregularis]|uniref:Glutathione S-transferase n=1 Tax=Symbiochloris irregularis TaxID=706552 RepID=A0AAW1NRJ6_9CHLO
MTATNYAAAAAFAAVAVAIGSKSASVWPAALQGFLEKSVGTASAPQVQASITTLLVAAVGYLGLSLKRMFTISKPKIPDFVTPLQGNPEDAIELVDYAGRAGMAGSISPYVSKIHAFLVFAKLPYTTKRVSSPEAGPKDKLPFIHHGPNVVPDTAFIMAYLRNTYGKGKKDLILGPVTDEQRAKIEAYIALIETSLPFGMAYYRLLHPQGAARLPKFFGEMGVPGPMQGIVGALVKAKMSKIFIAGGMGRHSQQDLDWLVQKDLRCMSTLLGNQPYLLGKEPSEADATLFGLLDVLLYDGLLGEPMVDMVKKHDNLVKYTARIRKTFFADKLKEHL